MTFTDLEGVFKEDWVSHITSNTRKSEAEASVVWDDFMSIVKADVWDKAVDMCCMNGTTEIPANPYRKAMRSDDAK